MDSMSKPAHPVDPKLHESVRIKPVDGELLKSIQTTVTDVCGAPGDNPSSIATCNELCEALGQLFAAHLQAAVREARRDERSKFKKLWNALGLRFGASAGSAIGVTVTNSFGESWDFQLDRDAVNELLRQLNQGEK